MKQEVFILRLSTPRFVLWGSCCSFFCLVCVGFLCLFSSCVLCAQCCQYLWIVHSWFSIFSYIMPASFIDGEVWSTRKQNRKLLSHNTNVCIEWAVHNNIFCLPFILLKKITEYMEESADIHTNNYNTLSHNVWSSTTLNR